jgi:hypothetical protein
LKQNFEFFRFKVIAPEFSFNNSAPIISNFVEYLTIYSNESMKVKVADFFDMVDKKTLSIALKASCPNSPSDWIKLSDA